MGDTHELSNLLRDTFRSKQAITLDDFDEFIKHPEVAIYFECRGVSETSAVRFFRILLDSSGSETIEVEAIVRAFVKLQNRDASCLDLQVLYVELTEFRKSIERKLRC